MARKDMKHANDRRRNTEETKTNMSMYTHEISQKSNEGQDMWKKIGQQKDS